MLLDALLGLAFATATRLTRLTSQHTTTRRIIMQKARHHAAPEVRGPKLEVRTIRTSLVRRSDIRPQTSDLERIAL